MKTKNLKHTLLFSLLLFSACGKFSTDDMASSTQGSSNPSEIETQKIPGFEGSEDNGPVGGRDSRPGENPVTVTKDDNGGDYTDPTTPSAPNEDDTTNLRKPELDSVLYTNGALNPDEVVENGYIEPTIYDFPIFNEDANPCDKELDLLNRQGEMIIRVCPYTLSTCGEEGSCAIIKNGTRYAVNVLGRVKGQDHFIDIGRECPFGYGVRNICLDPFYTLAADLKIYKPGEVIFIPAVQGLGLPDGSKHDGFFVIRDEGRGVKGRGRFDFFTGYFRWNNSKNPFLKLKLGDTNSHHTYYRVKGARAEAVKAARGYPRLPANPIDEMPAK